LDFEKENAQFRATRRNHKNLTTLTLRNLTEMSTPKL